MPIEEEEAGVRTAPGPAGAADEAEHRVIPCRVTAARDEAAVGADSTSTRSASRAMRGWRRERCLGIGPVHRGGLASRSPVSASRQHARAYAQTIRARVVLAGDPLPDRFVPPREGLAGSNHSDGMKTMSVRATSATAASDGPASDRSTRFLGPLPHDAERNAAAVRSPRSRRSTIRRPSRRARPRRGGTCPLPARLSGLHFDHGCGGPSNMQVRQAVGLQKCHSLRQFCLLAGTAATRMMRAFATEPETGTMTARTQGIDEARLQQLAG